MVGERILVHTFQLFLQSAETFLFINVLPNNKILDRRKLKVLQTKI